MSNITVKHPVLKPATLLPTPDNETQQCCCPPTGLLAKRHHVQTLIWFSLQMDQLHVTHKRATTEMVLLLSLIMKLFSPAHHSAQAAALIALTEACRLANNKAVTI